MLLRVTVLKELALLVGFFLVYYAPTIIGGEGGIFAGERDENCEMNTPTAYLMFACTMVAPYLVVRIGFLIAYMCKSVREVPVNELQTLLEKTKKAQVGLDVIFAISSAIFFFWTLPFFLNTSKECFHGYNLLDSVTWFLCLLLTIRQTILVLLMAICSPCICLCYCMIT